MRDVEAEPASCCHSAFLSARMAQERLLRAPAGPAWWFAVTGCQRPKTAFRIARSGGPLDRR
jgi:hypothetical protein